MTVNIHTSTHTLSIILLVSTGGAVCVWVLGTAGDYIHPAAGSPRGEGGNVIYTLITRAPLNTPPDRCNILDISSSFFTPLFFPLFPSFRLNPPYNPEPHADICSPRHEYRAVEVQRCCCALCMFMCVCRMCKAELLYVTFTLSFSLTSIFPPSKCILYPSPPIAPLYKSIFRGWGDQPCGNSTVPPPMGN